MPHRLPSPPAGASLPPEARLFALSLDLLGVLGVDGRYRRVNPAFARALGRPVDEILGTTFLGYVHPDDRADTARAWSGVLAGVGVDAFECRIPGPGGEERWYSWRATPPDAEGLVYAVGREVTERRHVDAALRRSEALLRVVLASGRMGVWDFDVATGCATYSDGVGPILGRPRGWQPTPDDDFPDRIHADDRPAFLAESYRAIAEGRAVALQVRVAMPDGSPRWILSHGEPQRDAGTGAVTHFRGVVIDVTDRVLLEARLREAQRLEAVGQLAGGVAHDFNNLLTVITGYGDLARDALAPDDPVRDDVEEIRAAAARGARVVRQLLAFGRRQVLHPASVALNHLLEERAPMFARMLGAAREVTLDLAPEVGPVEVDPGQLDQALLNLVLNARDAMARMPAGTLALTTRRVGREDDRPARAGLPPGDYVALAVRDSGEGMSAEVQARAFEPFFTTRAVGAGSGLGLATVHGIVAQSGGAITLDSAPGHGATFTILLPVASAADDGPRPEEPAAVAPRPAARATVLVVEDEPGVRRSVRRVLEREGYTVHEAESGHDALAVYERCGGDVDVLLTDVLMPAMGGPELASVLRAARADLPVVFMSGYTEDPEAIRALTATGAGFVAKPFALAALGDAVRAALARAAR